MNVGLGKEFGKHIQTLAHSISAGCSCEDCVLHLVREVVLYCSQHPLEHPPTHHSENGMAAHLRDELKGIAWRLA